MINERVEAIRRRHNSIEAMEPSTVVDYRNLLIDAHRDRGELLAYIASLQVEPTREPRVERPEYDGSEDLCVVKGCTGLACKGSFVCWEHRVKPENRGAK